LVNREELLEFLNDIDIGPNSRKLSEINEQQLEMLHSHQTGAHHLYWISDMQEGMTNFENIAADSSTQIRLLLLQSQQQANIYIDSCWLFSPTIRKNQSEELMVRIKNNGSETVNDIPVKLFVNDKQKALASASIPAGGSVEVPMRFSCQSGGIQHCYVSIDDHPITFDDKYYFSFFIREHIKVLQIGSKEENVYISQLFSQDSTFQYTYSDEKKIDYSSLPEFALIIVCGMPNPGTGFIKEMLRFSENGGHVLVFPSVQMEASSYRQWIGSAVGINFEHIDTSRSKVVSVDFSHPLYHHVFDEIPRQMDFPEVFSHYKLSGTSSAAADIIMRLQNGDPFLMTANHAKGKIWICSTPLEANTTNFGRQVLFVPTILNIALFSQAYQQAFYLIGKDEPIETGNISASGDQAFRVTESGTDNHFIPQSQFKNGRTQLHLSDYSPKAGNYNVSLGDSAFMGISFNYSRAESAGIFPEKNILEAQISAAGFSNMEVISTGNLSYTEALNHMHGGTKLWKWFILGALFFLALEIALIRLWKVSI
jgi:hypothetical protein